MAKKPLNERLVYPKEVFDNKGGDVLPRQSSVSSFDNTTLQASDNTAVAPGKSSLAPNIENMLTFSYAEIVDESALEDFDTRSQDVDQNEGLDKTLPLALFLSMAIVIVAVVIAIQGKTA